MATVLDVVPANDASWDDVKAVFGARGDAAHCWCQRYKSWDLWSDIPREALADRLFDQAGCGDPEAGRTSGLVGYLDGEPVAWCAVEPRTEYARLLRMPIPWQDRPEQDRADASVWAVTCFVVRAGYRRRGFSRVMAKAAVDYARERGASALEAYPMVASPGQDVTWGEMHVGARSIFAAAGFAEVTHPSKRRYVMRIDFA